MRDVYYQNPNQRTPCVLVLDVSQSMQLASDNPNNVKQERRIELLNKGIEIFYNDLMQDETAKNRVRLAIVMVGGPTNQAELMMDWTDAVDFMPMTFNAQGLTPLAQGMNLALDLIEDEVKNLRSNGINLTRPWIMVLSDGQPTDVENWPQAVARCQEAEKNKKCIIYPIGVDIKDSELAILQQISATPAMHLQSYKFKEFFVWLSASLKSVSISAPGNNAQLPNISPWATVST